MSEFMSTKFWEALEVPAVGWAGDWHGNTKWAILSLKDMHKRGVRVLYHVGDFGLWHGEYGLDYRDTLQAVLDYNDMVIIVTPGNHENYDILDQIPLNDEGFQVSPEHDRIWYAPRGHIWTHHGAYLASLGGAGSIDKAGRVLGESWWPQEEITEFDVLALKENMTSLNIERVDVIMMHDVPAGISMFSTMRAAPEIEHYCYGQRVLLRQAVDLSMPRAIVHGHWHRRQDVLLTGVSPDDQEYDAFVYGLDMDGTRGNLMTGELAMFSGIIDVKRFYPQA